MTNKVPDIEEVIKYLKDKSKINPHGKNGAEVLVDKEYLKYASIYLEDYLYTSGRI